MNLNGLSSAEVQKKIRQGKVNKSESKNQTTIKKIILSSTLTVFNLVNLILAIMIISVGAYKNLLFLLVAIANTGISIINGIRAKKTIDKMRLIAEQKPAVIRDGKTIQIPQDQIVEGDLLVYALGDQIIVDSEVQQGTIEVNESFITGEQDNIIKHPGDKLISGSFVVSGTCKATATAVGKDNFINKLESDAHTIKTADSKLFSLINNIVKYISIALIPIGALLLWSRFNVGTTTEVAVTSTVAGLISMIPEGLVLLTSSVLALATIRLSRKQVLVQDLYSIETLARVDTICLDKTGTLTTGRMTVRDIIPAEGSTKNALENALKLILSSQTTDNATSTALKKKLLKTAKYKPTEQIREIIPFSSDRKYSGVRTDQATYIMGAPEFILEDKSLFKEIESTAHGGRIIAVIKQEAYKAGGGNSGNGLSKGVRSAAARELAPAARGRQSEESSENRACSVFRDDDGVATSVDGPAGRAPREAISELLTMHQDRLLGFVILDDELRRDAKEIIQFFKDNNVAIKVISGDNKTTVQTIAASVGVPDPKAVDLSSIKDLNYAKLVKEYNIFTRVKPAQKKSLIKALRSQGATVAMTGDGVNDILAMKEADCSIAIGEGSDAARRAAKLVLLKSDFSSVPKIIAEGRQSINNLERSATLFLSKNTYAAILAVLFILIPIEYPYAPLEMSLLNVACIGLPGVVLALEKNTARIKDQFVKNILQFSVPTGITVAITMLVFSIIASNIGYTRPELITTSAIVTFAIDFLLIYSISRPLNLLRSILMLVSASIVTLAIMIPLTRNFLDFTLLPFDKLIIAGVLIAGAYTLFALVRVIMRRLTPRIVRH